MLQDGDKLSAGRFRRCRRKQAGSIEPDSRDKPGRNLRQRNIGWRIDYVLASRSLAASATRAASLREFGTSDHAPVVAHFV